MLKFFKSHKIVGQRAFQICTEVIIQNCPNFNETYLKLFVLTQRFGKKKTVLHALNADL